MKSDALRYIQTQPIRDTLRLPLEGYLDLTYGCHNNCRHCWVRISPTSPERESELTFNEIRRLVEEARGMGCRMWYLSGGEPMLRPDFPEIFDFVTRRSASYALNTNGTLISPTIAQLLRRNGVKWVAVYGATAEVHDHVTRSAGSFEAMMRGIAYLREAGARFVVQLVPMRDNYHQYQRMVALAESLSPYWRVGSTWLYLSASHDPAKNAEIQAQRLDPKAVVELRGLHSAVGDLEEAVKAPCVSTGVDDDWLFLACTQRTRSFHVDPYGRMTFCELVRDPSLRYDIRKGSFREFWEEFLPSLAHVAAGGAEYRAQCGACALREDCAWCPAHAHLEHGTYSAKMDYLCAVARESRSAKAEWISKHRRYYHIAGITIQVQSDLPITDETFGTRFKPFQVDRPTGELVTIQHHFHLPDLSGHNLGVEVYRKAPWTIFRKRDSWIYLNAPSDAEGTDVHQVVVLSKDYTRVRMYTNGSTAFRRGDLGALSRFPSDQILLVPLLASRQGCYIHASGVSLEGKGLLFVGHSEAGKSTMVKMLRGRATILCDDRIIVRRWPEGFRIHGTWSHGEIAEVSAAAAPLNAIFFLRQAQENRIVPVESRQEAVKELLSCVIRAFVNAEWWEKTLDLIEQMASEVPCWVLHFDRSGQVVDLLRDV